NCLDLLLLAVSLWTPVSALATPVVGPINGSPTTIPAGSPTQVTVTVQITDPTLIPGSVNLLLEDATGKILKTLGVMHDDGKNGDAVAGDKIFTLLVSFNPSQPGQIYLQASAAFKGLQQRVTSPVLIITVTGTPAVTGFSPQSGSVGTLVNVTLGNFSVVQGVTPQVTLSG